MLTFYVGKKRKSEMAEEIRTLFFRSPIDPVTCLETDEPNYYRGRLLCWGLKSDYDAELKCIITNTVAIVESVDINSEGRYAVLTFLPEEIEFE